jgi:hypothetical protein
LLGDDGLNLMTQLINNTSIYENGERSRDFIEVTSIALKKTPKTRNALIIAQCGEGSDKCN